MISINKTSSTHLISPSRDMTQCLGNMLQCIKQHLQSETHFIQKLYDQVWSQKQSAFEQQQIQPATHCTQKLYDQLWSQQQCNAGERASAIQHSSENTRQIRQGDGRICRELKSSKCVYIFLLFCRLICPRPSAPSSIVFCRTVWEQINTSRRITCLGKTHSEVHISQCFHSLLPVRVYGYDDSERRFPIPACQS